MAEDPALQKILKRLNVLIMLQIGKSLSEDKTTLAAKIVGLSELGLESSEIADIISKPSNYVSATLAKRKKAPKGEVKPNE